MNLKIINNWNCYILNNMISESKGKYPIVKNNFQDTKVIYWGIGKDNLELVKYVFDYIEKNSVINKDTSYIICAFEVPNWNDYFSPWITIQNIENQNNSFSVLVRGKMFYDSKDVRIEPRLTNEQKIAVSQLWNLRSRCFCECCVARF